MMTTMPILAILAIMLLGCVLAAANTDTSCNTTQTAINTLLNEDMQDMSLESNLQMNLDNTRGSVLSAVFQPVSSKGFLNRSMINVARGASFSVSYDIAIQDGIDNMKLTKAELWLYPRTRENSTLLDLHVQIRAEALNLSRMVTRRPGHTWKSRDQCIPLDVTSALKKLFRALHNRGKSSARVKITVSIVNVLRRINPILLERLRDSRCQVLTAGCNQKQFLVLKYSRPRSTGEGAIRPGVIEPVSSPTQATTSSQQETNTTTAPSRAPPTSRQPCQIEDHYINFNSSGFTLAYPNRINIKRCSGECSLTDRRKLTIHGQLKRYFSDLSSCCVPTELRETNMIISKDGVQMLISLKDAVVEQCGCR